MQKFTKYFKTYWILFLTIFIIMGFLILLIEHPFDPTQIIMNIDEEETIVLIEQSTDDVYNNTLTNNTKPTQHIMHDVILSNPLNNKQCQNAILHRYNLSRHDFIHKYYNESLYKKCKKSRIWDHEGIWTREYIDAISTQNCFTPRLMLRTSLNKLHYNTTDPIFYHIPKTASSSTATMAKDYFNFGSKWITRHEIIRHPYNASKCGFTFVRDPIKRFISGYYTVNAMIFGENELNFTNHNNSKFHKYKFIKTFGEPARFDMFLDELMDKAFDFYGVVPLRHIASQTYFLSNFYGSNIDFIGRVENYNKHWIELLNYENCGKWFRNENNKKNKWINIEHVMNGMYHYGFDSEFYSQSNKRVKYKEYIEAMSMDVMMDNNYKLPPIYHLMTREIYNKIV
eukprot:84781_1